MNLLELVKIESFFKELSNTKLTIQVSYKIMKLLAEIAEDCQFYKQHLTQIVEEYGQKDSKGEYIILENQSIKIKEGMEKDCLKNMQSLEMTEVKKPSITFKIEEFENLEISPNQLIPIMVLITE